MKTYISTIVATAMALGTSGGAGAASPDDDLGFTSAPLKMEIGSLLRRAFSVTDSDACFIINDAPILYKKPKAHFAYAAAEAQLETVLSNARANAGGDWHRLAMLLETASCYYRKMNRRAEALQALAELLALVEEREPNSLDLCTVQLAFAQMSRAMHQYDSAERTLRDALDGTHRLSGKRGLLAAQIQAEFFFLYLDMGRMDLAVKARRECIASYRIDMVAVADQKIYDQSDDTWPMIIRSIDGAATQNDLAIAEKRADAAAQAAAAGKLTDVDVAYEAPPDDEEQEAETAADAAQQAQEKKGDKKKTIIPVRLRGGTDGH